MCELYLGELRSISERCTCWCCAIADQMFHHMWKQVWDNADIRYGILDPWYISTWLT